MRRAPLQTTPIRQTAAGWSIGVIVTVGGAIRAAPAGTNATPTPAATAIDAELRGPNGREWLMRWLPARAHDNGLFILFSNGIGQDDDEVRTGNAMILDPYGRVVAETWAAADDMVVADLDLESLPLSTGRRWLQGRRPELYGILTRRFGDERDPRTARFAVEPVPVTRIPRT